MTISELTLRKIQNYYERKDCAISAVINIEREVVLEKCRADGDILTLVCGNGEEYELDLWDCNDVYRTGDCPDEGVQIDTKDGKSIFIS